MTPTTVSTYKLYTCTYIQPIPPYYYAAVTYIVATEHMATLYGYSPVLL